MAVQETGRTDETGCFVAVLLVAALLFLAAVIFPEEFIRFWAWLVI